MEKTEGQKNGEQKAPYVEGDAWSGLTKREYFAGQILSGMMANINHSEDHIVYAQQAVAYADALFEALSEP
jgi:hypothetical protein